MDFEWDEDKRQANLRKHGLDFADAPTVFQGYFYTVEDDRTDYDEDRFLTAGFLRGEVVALIHTPRGDATRVISLRKADKYEQQLLFNSLGN